MEAGTLPKRADAIRNRERVVAAAAAVFAERGIEAGVPEIAARAGVGKATVYRSFPTKEHLIAAVVEEKAADLRVLWIGVVRVLTADGVEDPAAWRRYGMLALGALRA